MTKQTTTERPTAERGVKNTESKRTSSAALWVVLTVSLSVPLGGAVTGYLLASGEFSVINPFFLFFSLVSLASALLSAAGTALLLTQ